MRKSKHLKIIAAAFAVVAAFTGAAYATEHSSSTQFSQTINSGSLSVDILDDNQQTVAEPGVVMSAITAATSCQDPGSTGKLGTDTERLYVDNPEAANNGWTLSIAATDGSIAEWESGANTMSYNDPADGGCETGQMSIDPSTNGNINTANTTTGITLGSPAAFDSVAPVDAIELASAAEQSDDIWRGYFTDIDVDQIIPAEQPTGTYTLDMTITATSP